MDSLQDLAGKKIHNAQIIMIFKANGKLYHATKHNCEVMDAYTHTGDDAYLDQLTDEMEF